MSLSWVGVTDRLTVSHHHGDRVDVRYGELPLLSYVYEPRGPVSEGPKPYLHPVRTLAGDVVTAYRPHDHPWHKGIQMTAAHLAIPGGRGRNFWGGPTYVHGEGYVPLDNVGAMVHLAFDDIAADGEAVRIGERLEWRTETGEPWIAEHRRLCVTDIDATAKSWTLRYETSLANISGQPLHWGSPTTEGREAAGYGGVFWRGPRDLTGGTVHLDGADQPADPAGWPMGERGRWLAYQGRHDGTLRCSTLVFVDHPANPRHPTKWFVRREPFPAVSFAVTFDEVLTIPEGGLFDARYDLVVASGELTTERISAIAAAAATAP